jgi:hypothetical protein
LNAREAIDRLSASVRSHPALDSHYRRHRLYYFDGRGQRAPRITMALTPALRNDRSLRRFANAALGKEKRVMSVILSDPKRRGASVMSTANDCFSLDPPGRTGFVWECLLMAPIKMS